MRVGMGRSVLRRLIIATRPQYGAVASLCVRDIPLQLATGLLVCVLCWLSGHPVIAFSVGASVIASEAVLWRMFQAAPPFDSLDKDQRLRLALILCCINTVLYLLPAVFLAGDPSLAMKITAFFWILGSQVYIANSWSRVPVFLVGILSLAMVMTVIGFFQLRQTPPEPSSMTDWGIAMGFLLIFLYSSIDTLRQHLSTEADLHRAQRDIIRRMAELEEAHRLDVLTGLLNRPAFDLALHVMLEDRATSGGEVAVFLVDLDSFKPINDTYSHDAGDNVLITTARRLTNHIGEGGIVGRLGGDEFVCAVAGLETPDDATHFARDLAAQIAAPIRWHGRTLKISASIGIGMTGRATSFPPATVPALCSAADQAMFAAKSSTNDGPIVYLTHMFAPRMTSQDKQDLMDGIHNHAVKPYYQPKIHLPTGQIIGFEALARWEHPKNGVRQPAEFIEQINELGRQGDFMIAMANQVVADIGTMLDMGLDPGQVSLNVPEVALATHSGRQDLHRIIAQNPRVAQHLTFEITEDVFIARSAETIQSSIATFRALGVRISLDDFGTGFASFHHLRQLDFDEMKIDTSIVEGLSHDPTSEVLVRGFLSIASGLGVSVIAEGVETESQSRDLINMGCLTAQGYLFSAAIPLSRATDLLQQQQAA